MTGGEEELDVAAGAGAIDGQGLVGTDERLVPEHAADGLDLGRGQEERLARVRVLTFRLSRQPSRRRIAGAGLGLGTKSTYIAVSWIAMNLCLRWMIGGEREGWTHCMGEHDRPVTSYCRG